VRKRIEDTGSLIVANTPEQFAAQIKAEFEVYKKVVAKPEAQARLTPCCRQPARGRVFLVCYGGVGARRQPAIDAFIDALWLEEGLSATRWPPTGAT
jgi:hypothetical protein